MKKDSKETAIYVAWDDFQPFDPVAPEKNLLLAILTTALADLKKRGHSARKARDYLLSTEDDYIFSFQSVCSYLQMDPQVLLQKTGVMDEDCEDFNF